MKKLQDFAGVLFVKEEMKKVKGGNSLDIGEDSVTKTRLTGTTTTVNGQTSLEAGDTSNVD